MAQTHNSHFAINQSLPFVLLVFVLVSDVCVSRCNHTDQSEVQLIIQRLLAKVAHSARKTVTVWSRRGSKLLGHDSSHASLQQQLLVSNILNMHSSVNDLATLDNHLQSTSRPDPSFGHIQLTTEKRLSWQRFRPSSLVQACALSLGIGVNSPLLQQQSRCKSLTCACNIADRLGTTLL